MTATKRRTRRWCRTAALAIALGGALVLPGSGCKGRKAGTVDHEAKRAESDWKQRVDEARKYAARKQNEEPIKSAVGVKELPPRSGKRPVDGVEVVTLTATTTPEERARLREKLRESIPIVMYATSWCGVCAAARGYMKSNAIAYTERDVEREPDAQLGCISINPRCSVPTFDVDGLVMVGFRGKRLDAMIERATDLRLERTLERQPKTLLVGRSEAE